MANPKAVILVSGGLDSTTVLAMAQAQGFDCYTLSFDYGQRHRVELEAAKRISTAMSVCEHKTVVLDLRTIGGSALTDNEIDVPEYGGEGIPVTYVPARNIFIGVNAVDYSGYPDCRPDYIAAYESMANLATRSGTEGQKLNIRTPLIELTKAQIIQKGVVLGVDYGLTVSCYQADSQGKACGVCDSCHLRRQGFIEAGLKDPTNYVI